MDVGTISSEDVREQLGRITAADGFRSSVRLRAFLEFTVERALAGETDQLKETVLGPAVCGRIAKNFDPRVDPVVRVTASRLRDALEKYYSGPGISDSVEISYPAGSYVPVIQRRSEQPAAMLMEAANVRARQRRWAIYTLPGFAVLAIVAYGLFRPAATPPPRAPVRFQVFAPKDAIFTNLSLGGPSRISPDGKYIVFQGIRGNVRLWVHSLTTMTVSELDGSEGAKYPFWSPDSRSIGFFQGGKLQKVALGGGPPVTICDAPSGFGGTWSSQGAIIFAPSMSSGLVMTSAHGSPAKPLTQLTESAGDLNHLWPSFLPDGRHFIYTVQAEPGDASAIYVSSVDKPLERRRLWTANTNAEYVALPGQKTGLLLYGQDDALLGIRFDPERLAVMGDPMPQERPVGLHPMTGLADFSVSATGTLVFRGGPAAPMRELLWLDRSGKRLARRLQPGQFRYPQVSPDGRTIAVSVSTGNNGNADIWLVDADSDSFVRFAFEPPSEFGPVWSPDGKYIAYAFARDRELRRKPVRGAGASELLFSSDFMKYPTSWSPDGRYLIFNNLQPSTRYDIWALPLEGDRKPFVVVQSGADELEGQISPDGRWLAYNSNESGTYQIYVESFPPSPGNRRRVQISSRLAHGPRWRRDGRELYYYDDGMLMAVPVQLGSEFVSGAPKPLFDVHSIYHSSYAYYPAPDGSRFLFSAAIEGEWPAPPAITVALDRFAGR